MKHLSDALNTLHDDCAWFTRARELRMLVVRTSGDMRTTVTRLLPRYEFLADNRSPWVLLEDAYETAVPQWHIRAARLMQHWEQRREAFAREGVVLPALAPVDPASRSTGEGGIEAFRAASAAILGALRPPLEGLVVVLAPTIVDGAAALDADLLQLLARPELLGLRIVLVIDVDVPVPARTIEVVAAAGMVCDCVTDPRQKRRDLDVLVNPANDTTPFAGASPTGITPPRRVDAPPDVDPAVRDAVLRQAGIDPSYLEHAPALRRMVLGAALAMGDGRTVEGIRLQTEVVRLSRQVHMPQMMLICQITLASYLAASGARGRALEELAAAKSGAAEHGLPDQESQACLAQGLLYGLEKRPLDASEAYYRCAVIAGSTGADVLAIEAWRLAGQAALDGGAIEHGVRYLRHALTVAGSLDVGARGNTSAPEVARQLAKMYADRGSVAHADALYAQADAIELGASDGPVPVVTEPPSPAAP